MSETMEAQIRHLQERLVKALRERDEARNALRPFAEAYRKGDFRDPTTDDGSLRLDHFARAAALVPDTSQP